MKRILLAWNPIGFSDAVLLVVGLPMSPLAIFAAV
jgi:hypothetical protein